MPAVAAINFVIEILPFRCMLDTRVYARSLGPDCRAVLRLGCGGPQAGIVRLSMSFGYDVRISIPSSVTTTVSEWRKPPITSS